MKGHVALIKFKYHTSFLAIVLIAFFFAGFSAALAWQLALLYISFNLLLYTGLYVLNDIADLQADRQHPRKRNRLIASGRMRLRVAFALALLLITGGLVSGWMIFGKAIAAFYFGFVALNVFYSFFAKHVPFLELIANTLPHPLRAAMAFVLIGHQVPLILVAAYAFFMMGLMTMRRVVEKDTAGWEARRPLQHYRKGTLLAVKIASFFMLLALGLADNRLFLPLYAVMLLIYLIVVFGMYHSRFIRSLLGKVYTG
ncbi:UbiA family prenyltransferase [Candidatus Woesearchaeota archaeon]|nr:UbiA family prenyltransferase [Candidatus Woesearchaeota archaeon]